MSWLYSRALVEAYSAATCSDGAPSAPSSATPTPQAYCAADRMTAFSSLSRFGMTCGALTEPLGEDVLTWCREDSRVRTSAAPAKEQASPENDPGSGPRWRELSVRYDRDSCSWKTHRTLWAEDLPWSSVTLPRWGMMRGGVCWEQTMLERRTEGSGSGLWPTPMAAERQHSPMLNGRGEPNLAAQVMWPTPTGQDNPQVVGQYPDHPKRGTTLGGAVQMFPTPQANEDAAGTPRGNMQRMLGNCVEVRGETQEEWAGGSLNPNWVCWLMGWPLGFTAPTPLSPVAWAAWQQAFLRESTD